MGDLVREVVVGCGGGSFFASAEFPLLGTTLVLASKTWY